MAQSDAMGTEGVTPLCSQPQETQEFNAEPCTPKFDPSRMIGIIRRKALIKDLAAVYHAECLAYCQELLELQSKWEQDLRKEAVKPAKRSKKVR